MNVAIDDLLDILVGAEGSEQDDSDIRRELPDLSRRSKAVQARHSDIHEENGRALLDGEIDCFATIICLADDLDGFVQFDQ